MNFQDAQQNSPFHSRWGSTHTQHLSNHVSAWTLFTQVLRSFTRWIKSVLARYTGDIKATFTCLEGQSTFNDDDNISFADLFSECRKVMYVIYHREAPLLWQKTRRQTEKQGSPANTSKHDSDLFELEDNAFCSAVPPQHERCSQCDVRGLELRCLKVTLLIQAGE